MSVLSHLNLDDLDGSRIKDFQRLMRFKVRDVLLVSSLYDQYLFEEDGRLYELMRQEFQVLNLSHPPEITHLTGASEALDLLSSGEHFDLIITTMHIEDMHVIQFARKVREHSPTVPLILLAYDNRERKELVTQYDVSIFDRLFIWQGDYRLMIAIIKHIEDRMNVEEDSRNVGVQVIILVEDDVKFYSTYLPLIYTEILNQSQRLISEGVSLTHRFLRMRARPKILLCTTYEEAWSYFEQYQEYTLGIISDINFKRGGVKDPEGGFSFAQVVRSLHEDIPILLQSSHRDFAERARGIGASFLWKNSPRLLHDLRSFLMNNFGFGDFVFRVPSGQEVGRAQNLIQLEALLHTVPDESIVHHARRNHFSNWLKARTEFWLAHKLRPRRVDDFPTVSDLRNELITSLRLYQEFRQRGVITEFAKESFDPKNSFARIGSGSLGGKARGLGFINMLINNYSIHDRFPGVDISVPSAVVIATDVFDRFLLDNNLESIAQNCADDVELHRRFTEAPNFPQEILVKIRDFLSLIREPLAVRSSSLLEDSQYLPFAGVYETYMLPNNHPDDALRLEQLIQAIKLVFASVFTSHARAYLKASDYRLEEEKMAVIVQRMVGAQHGERFYPDFAGVGKSYNFYPVAPQKSTDGIVDVALGLGKTVVEGGNSIRFCPKYPRHLLQFFSTAETIKTAQQEFYALDLHEGLSAETGRTPETFVKQYDLAKAEADGTLNSVGSTYSAENETVYDGLSRHGRRVVTFAPILKHKAFPLPEIMDLILEMGTWGMGTAVEVEFAVTLKVAPGHPKEFGVLQIRPLVLSRELEELKIGKMEKQHLICESEQVLGNGGYSDIHDLVVVNIHKFERAKSREVALEVAQLNARLIAEKRPYVLIGVGRWGSLDHWLGIPVTWDQISGASTIVESGFKDFSVVPSQGSHFFQNITSFRIGYFTVNASTMNGFIDWDWILQQPAVHELTFTRHLRFDEPILVRINGHENKGVILKPGVSPNL
jgi:CheY-like chemotaxis protein